MPNEQGKHGPRYTVHQPLPPEQIKKKKELKDYTIHQPKQIKPIGKTKPEKLALGQAGVPGEIYAPIPFPDKKKRDKHRRESARRSSGNSGHTSDYDSVATGSMDSRRDSRVSSARRDSGQSSQTRRQSMDSSALSSGATHTRTDDCIPEKKAVKMTRKKKIIIGALLAAIAVVAVITVVMVVVLVLRDQAKEKKGEHKGHIDSEPEIHGNRTYSAQGGNSRLEPQPTMTVGQPSSTKIETSPSPICCCSFTKDCRDDILRCIVGKYKYVCTKWGADCC